MAVLRIRQNKSRAGPKTDATLMMRNAGRSPLCSRRPGGLVIKRFLTLDKAIGLINSSPPAVSVPGQFLALCETSPNFWRLQDSELQLVSFGNAFRLDYRCLMDAIRQEQLVKFLFPFIVVTIVGLVMADAAAAPSAETAKRCVHYSYIAHPYKRPGAARMSGDRQAYFKDCMAKDGNVPIPVRP